jgi:titin
VNQSIQIFQGSKHKLVYDGMWHFDIPKCRDADAGKVEVIARNSCGEAYSTTTLTVSPRQDDYRAVLKHNVKRKSFLSFWESAFVRDQ